jgi:creatinine amidohydrolase
MTEFFAFDELTWPEVQALPRDTPLVIPLGSGYPILSLAEALSHPEKAGLLPPIPFGWRGSMLAVDDGTFAQVVSNLLDSLRDDGFSRVYALTPPGLSLGLGESKIALPARSNGLHSSPHPGRQYPADEDLGKVILIPIGHTEQHGYHLPLSTDTLIIEAVAQGVAQAISQFALSLPVTPYGVSTHRQAFAGTLNVGGRAFEDFWLAILDQLVWRGVEQIYFLSGHGGNCSFLANVVKYGGERHRRSFCATAWLYLSGPKGIAAIEKHRQSKIGGMGHACELETSLILHLRPDLVHMERAVDETDYVSTPSYYMDWVEGGTLIANPPWDDDTATGAYGAGSLATAEKGALWLDAAIEEKIDHVHEILEQQARREAKRRAGFGLWGRDNQ